MILQLVDLTVFSEQDMKKNIKARVQLSDGCSRVTAMIAEKTFAGFVSVTIFKLTRH
jgi:hypothetical protein